jgi:replication factor C subunit 2/4
MRQAVNNLQSTWSGFGFVNAENVFKVCDQPHPVMCQEIIGACVNSNIDKAVDAMNQLWTQGFSALDIVTTLFKVTKNYDMPEYLKLEFIKV